MRRALILAGLSGLLAVAFVGGYALVRPSAPAAPSPTVVEAVRLELASRYYRPLSPRVLRLDSVAGMIAALHDPYTRYLDRSAFSLVQHRLAARYAGIGVGLLPVADGLLVAGVRPGPAQRAGIREGDLVARVDGVATGDATAARAEQLLVGPAGGPLRLVVRRGGRTLRFVLRRSELSSPNVTARTIVWHGHRVGYVGILWFGEGTSGRVAAAVRAFRAAHVRGIVLDVRDDPGGLLREGIGTASLFLRGGRIVTVVGAHQARHTYEAGAVDLAGRLPLAVLIDHGTASAAEVLAAALHDDGRATLVGCPTFGKAVVQAVQPLADGGALALTVARYYTPSGADISRRGVAPDVRVVQAPTTGGDDVLAAALRRLTGSHA